MRQITCPICRQALPATASESATFPFCSERCRDVDLLRWCKGSYAIVEPLDPEQVEVMQDTPQPGSLDDYDE